MIIVIVEGKGLPLLLFSPVQKHLVFNTHGQTFSIGIFKVARITYKLM